MSMFIDLLCSAFLYIEMFPIQKFVVSCEENGLLEINDSLYQLYVLILPSIPFSFCFFLLPVAGDVWEFFVVWFLNGLSLLTR